MRATASTCFWKAFLSTRGGYRVGIPRVPLGDLYEGCRKALAAQGGEVHAARRCARISRDGWARDGVEKEDGAVETADYYLAAVPQDVLPELLPAEVVEREPVFSKLRNLQDFADYRSASVVRSHRDERAVSHAARQHDAVGVQQDAIVWRRRGGRRAISATRDQRVVQSGHAFAPGNYRSVPGRAARGSSRDSRSHAGEGNRREGNVRDVFARAWIGPVASRAKKSARGIISCRRLDMPRAGRPQWREPFAAVTWLPKRFSPMLERHGNFCSRICARKDWLACGPAICRQQRTHGFCPATSDDSEYSQVCRIFDLHVSFQSMIEHPPGGFLGAEV